jgi:hypothetical protein
MAVIQLGGQFILYPSAFVGILAEELIDPLPKIWKKTLMDEASCSKVLFSNVLSRFKDTNLCSQSISTIKSGKLG